MPIPTELPPVPITRATFAGDDDDNHRGEVHAEHHNTTHQAVIDLAEWANTQADQTGAIASLDDRLTTIEDGLTAPFGGTGLFVPLIQGIYTWGSLDTSVTEADAAGHSYRSWIDLTDWSAFIAQCAVTTAATNARAAICYSTDDGVTWRYLSDGTACVGGGSPPAGNQLLLATEDANPRESSMTPITIVEAARTRVLLGPVAWMTSGTGSPAAANVVLRLHR